MRRHRLLHGDRASRSRGLGRASHVCPRSAPDLAFEVHGKAHEGSRARLQRASDGEWFVERRLGGCGADGKARGLLHHDLQDVARRVRVDGVACVGGAVVVGSRHRLVPAELVPAGAVGSSRRKRGVGLGVEGALEGDVLISKSGAADGEPAPYREVLGDVSRGGGRCGERRGILPRVFVGADVIAFPLWAQLAVQIGRGGARRSSRIDGRAARLEVVVSCGTPRGGDKEGVAVLVPRPEAPYL